MSPSSRSIPSLIKYVLYLLFALLLGVGLWYYTRPQLPQVELVKVEPGLVEATVSNTRAGSIKACRRAKLAPPAGGQISKMLVHKGQRVAAHQILLELWNKDLQAQSVLASSQLNTAQSQSKQACVQADLADAEATRARKLQSSGFISNEALDRSVTAARVARDGCDAARTQIAQSHSRIAAAQAGLERMVLRAPFAGVVADISGELGEFATPSPPGIPTPPAIDLIDDSCLFVSAPIDEVDAANIQAGQEARITLDAIKGRSFAGKVKRVAPYVLELEKQARTVEVEVGFVASPAAENLLVGYSADVEIVHASHANVLRVPTQSILEGKRVLVYQPNDGVLEERAVTLGLSNWEQSEISVGLKAGDQIVLAPDQVGIKAGVKVTPQVGPVKK
jgi:HlyD family secretion protein